jgi:ComEC/Rec2-related protein
MTQNNSHLSFFQITLFYILGILVSSFLFKFYFLTKIHILLLLSSFMSFVLIVYLNKNLGKKAIFVCFLFLGIVTSAIPLNSKYKNIKVLESFNQGEYVFAQGIFKKYIYKKQSQFKAKLKLNKIITRNGKIYSNLSFPVNISGRHSIDIHLKPFDKISFSGDFFKKTFGSRTFYTIKNVKIMPVKVGIHEKAIAKESVISAKAGIQKDKKEFVIASDTKQAREIASSLAASRNDEEPVVAENFVIPAKAGIHEPVIASAAKQSRIFDTFKLLYVLRKYLEDLIDKRANIYGGDGGAILKSIILGERSYLSYSMKKKFQKAGIYHIFAISGMHIAILYILLLNIFKRIFSSVNVAKISIALILVVYAILTGLSPSVVRAVTMVVLYIVAERFGRNKDTLNILALSAFIILLFNPLQFFDVGFQLSFSAVFFIIIFIPVLKFLEEKINIKNTIFLYLFRIFIVSTFLAIAMAPLNLFYFKRISVLAPFANLLVVPILPALVFLVIAYFIVSFLPYLPVLLAILINILVKYMIFITNLFS